MRSQVPDIVDGIPMLRWDVAATVHGWITFLRARELESWESVGVEVSVRIPLGVEVTKDDHVRAVRAPQGLEGEWRIRTVRYGPTHLRLMVTRS